MITASTETVTSPEVKKSKPMSSPVSSRSRIARTILYYHFALIFISCIYYIAKGFDLEEFTNLIGILAPVTALYGGAVFRYLGKSITEPNATEKDGEPITPLVKWLVNGHFAAVLGLISLKAFNPSILPFQDMVMFLTLVESAVGVYMGNILLALFEEGKK